MSTKLLYALWRCVPAVSEWTETMKAAGVQRVVSMLSDSELETYAEPLPAAMQAAFGEGKYVNINAKAPGMVSISMLLCWATSVSTTWYVHNADPG